MINKYLLKLFFFTSVLLTGFFTPSFSQDLIRVASEYEDSVRVLIIYNDQARGLASCSTGTGDVGYFTMDFVRQSLASITNLKVIKSSQVVNWATIQNVWPGKNPSIIVHVNAGFSQYDGNTRTILTEAANRAIGVVSVGDDAPYSAQAIFGINGTENEPDPMKDALWLNKPNDALWIQLNEKEDVFQVPGIVTNAISYHMNGKRLFFKPVKDNGRCQADADRYWLSSNINLRQISFPGKQMAYNSTTRDSIGHDRDSLPVIASFGDGTRRAILLSFQPQYLENQLAAQQIVYDATIWASNASQGISISPPILNPPSKNFFTPFTLTLSHRLTNVKLFYRFENVPTFKEYKGEVFNVSDNTTIYAYAEKEFWLNSDTIKGEYKKVLPPPTINPRGGTYTVAFNATINSSIPGTTIHYSFDKNSGYQIYDPSNPILINSDKTIFAYVSMNRWANSDTVKESYQLPKEISFTDVQGNPISLNSANTPFKIIIKDPSASNSIQVKLVTLGGDSLQVVLNQVAPGVFENTFTSQNSKAPNKLNSILETSLNLTGDTSIDSLTATYNSTQKGLRFSTYTPYISEISLNELTGGPLTAKFDYQITQFVVSIKDNKISSPVLYTLTTSNGDKIQVTLNETSPGVYLDTLYFKFDEQVNFNNLTVEGINSEKVVSFSATYTAIDNSIKSSNLITITKVAFSSWIIDGNGDGKADSIFIRHTKDLPGFPGVISNINWPDSSGPGKVASIGGENSIHIINDTTVVIDFTNDPFPYGATGASSTNPPSLSLQSGFTVPIQDKIAPILLKAEKKPSDGVYYELQPDETKILKKFPDLLELTFSEPIQNPSTVSVLDSLFRYIPSGNVNAPSKPIYFAGNPIVSSDKQTWSIPISGASLSLQDSPSANDSIYINPNTTLTDILNNPASSEGSIIEGSDYKGKGALVYVLNPIIGSEGENPTQSKTGEKLSIPVYTPSFEFKGRQTLDISLDQQKWVPPYGYNPSNGTVNSASQNSCTKSTRDNQFEVPLNLSCLSIMQVLSKEPFTANITIVDNLGLFIHSSTQKFGYCGEMRNQDRKAESGLFTAPLVWNQKDKKDKLVGSGVYVWKISIQYESGRSELVYKNQGIARNTSAFQNCLTP